MFSSTRPNVIESDGGFSIEVLGRTGLIYREGERAMFIDSEVLSTSGIEVYARSISSWRAPFDRIIVTDEKRRKIIDNIRAAFAFRGEPIYFS